MALSPRELEELIVLSRQVELQYGLDTFTDAQIRETRRAMQRASREITRELHNRIATDRLTAWQADRAGALLNEADRLTQGMQTRLAQDINRTASSAGLSALREHNSILSFTGMVGGFNQVALSSAQFASFFRDTPLHGHTLQNWVNRAFTREMQTKIRNEINTGVFRGKGYPDLVKRVNTAFTNLTNREAVTLTRSYVQAANVKAMTAVYDANADIVQKVKWSAVLENGYRSSGRGTCLICAGLDGRVYPKDDHPECPIHPRCRCTLLPVTKTFRELGLDIDEVKAVHRPYTIRQNKNIDAGGRRKIREVGFHQGDYGSWYKNQTDRTRINIVGPRRKAMLDRGDITFADLVNPRTGRVYRLQELDGNVMVKTPIGAPGAAQQLDEWGFRVGTKSNIFAEELLYNPLSGADIKALNWNSYGHTFAPIRQKLSKQGVLFKDGKGRWYTIKPDNIDDHADLGLKGLLEKLGRGKGPDPLPPPDPPVVKDYTKMKKKIRKTVGFKEGSKSEALLDGLMERPMSGKEIKEFMDSGHDFPAVRKKLVDLNVIAKNTEGRWFVIDLAEEGASEKVIAPIVKKATPKPTPKLKKPKAQKNTYEHYAAQDEKFEKGIRELAEEFVDLAETGDGVFIDAILDYDTLVYQLNYPGWQKPNWTEAQRSIVRKMKKIHDKALLNRYEMYKTAPSHIQHQMREKVIKKVTEIIPGNAMINHRLDDMIREGVRGTEHIPYLLLEDLSRARFKMKWGASGRANFSDSWNGGQIVCFLDDTRGGEVVAHEMGHAIDSFLGGAGKKYTSHFGYWKKSRYATPDEAKSYKRWYDEPKTGTKGTYSNGDGKYWKGNWINDYEGRIYGRTNQQFGHQFFSMGSQRYYRYWRLLNDKDSFYKFGDPKQMKGYVKAARTDARLIQDDIKAHLDYNESHFGIESIEYKKGAETLTKIREREETLIKIIEKMESDAHLDPGEIMEIKKIWASQTTDWHRQQDRYPEFAEWMEEFYTRI